MEKIKSQKKKKPGPLIPNLEKTIYTISLIIQTIVEEVIPFSSLHSGQHKDLLHSDATYKIDIVDGENRLDSVVSSLRIRKRRNGLTGLGIALIGTAFEGIKNC